MKTVKVYEDLGKAYFSNKLNLIATFVSSVLVAYQLSNFNIVSSVISAVRAVSI